MLPSLDRITQAMAKEGKSPATIKYAMAVASQVWNHARGFVEKEFSTRCLKKPKGDKKRVRFLTEDEAKRLLEALAERSHGVHDMSVLGIFCGAGSSEIFGLQWGDVDKEAGTIFLRRTKTSVSRHVCLTREVQKILERRQDGQEHNELIFPTSAGGKKRVCPRPLAGLWTNRA